MSTRRGRGGRLRTSGGRGYDAQGETALGLADVLLTQLSPAEQPVLPVFGPALLEQDGRPAGSDGSLGFGVTEVAWLPVAVPVANAVVGYLFDIVKDSVADAAKERLTGWLTEDKARVPRASVTGSLAAPAG
jgi:hypothetical protein